MSSNTRASVKNRANNDPSDEMKRRARRRLVGSLALFLTALIVVPALIEGEPNAEKPEIELVFPAKPGSQEVVAESKPADKQSDKQSGEILQAPADSNPDVILPPAKAPVEKSQPKVAEAPHVETHSEATEPKKPSVQDISKAAASKEQVAKEQAAKDLAIKELASKEAAAKESARLAAKAELAKKDALAKESATKEHAAKESNKEANKEPNKEPAKSKPAEKSEDVIAKFADADSKPESHSKEPAAASTSQASKPTFIQVAALKDQARAEALRDELSAKGFASRVQSLVTDQGTVYRVRVGPFSDAEKADKTKSDLAKQGYNARVAQ